MVEEGGSKIETVASYTKRKRTKDATLVLKSEKS